MKNTLFWKQKQLAPVGDKVAEAGESGQNPGYSVPKGGINLGQALITFVARNRVNQLESRPIIEETSLANFPKFAQLLKDSNFPWLRKKITFDASKNGTKFVGLIPFNGGYILDAFDVKNYNFVGKFLQSVQVFTSETYVHDKVEYPVEYTFSVENGIAKIDKSITIITKDEVTEFELKDAGHTFNGKDWKTVAGDLFFGNFLRTSDVVAAGMSDAISHLDYHSNEMTTEWKTVLTRIRNNESFSSISDDELWNRINQGDRIIPENSFNNKLSAGQEVFTSGSNSITFNQLNINYIEDKCLKFIGVIRESTSTGANKHSLEITLQNQYATEVLYSIREMREENYKTLADVFSKASGENSASDVIELKVALIEEAKIALLQESVEQAKNKGSNQPQKGKN